MLTFLTSLNYPFKIMKSIRRDWVVIEIILEYVSINIKVLEERHSVDDKKNQVMSSLSL